MSIQDVTTELADAYDDPVMRKGAEDMRESIERVLQLLGHEK